METIVAEIRRALDAELFVVALQSTLAAVDICSALASDDGTTKQVLFRQWWEANLGPFYPNLDSADVYQLRCGMLHQGHSRGDQYSAIIFTLPSPNGSFWDNNIMNDALNLDLVSFCRTVLARIEAWWAASAANEPVASNSARLVGYRMDFPPYMSGMPMLA